jgi:hypothetical protein
VPRHALEEVTPGVVRLHADRNSEPCTHSPIRSATFLNCGLSTGLGKPPRRECHGRAWLAQPTNLPLLRRYRP